MVILSPPEKFDGSVLAQKAISAIIRSGEKVTLNLLIDVLRGSYRKEITSRDLHNIKTFGAGRDLSYNQWRNYLTQFLDKGLLRIDYVDGFKLKLTPLSMDAVKGMTTIMLSKFTEQDWSKPKKRVKNISAKERFELEFSEELKSWRKKKSIEKNVPAYVVLTDRTIDVIVENTPLLLKDLNNVEGIGEKRMMEYGTELITMIRNYVLNQAHKKSIKGKSIIITLNHLNEGLDPESIAKKREISVSTVYSHLIQLFIKDESVDLHKYVTEEEINTIRKAIIESQGDFTTSLIAERLVIPISFDKIRMAVAIIQKEGMPG